MKKPPGTGQGHPSLINIGLLCSRGESMTEQHERALFWWCLIVILLAFWVIIVMILT
jgi:hypothetical protein